VSWDDIATQTASMFHSHQFNIILISNVDTLVKNTHPICHQVYANLQGSKDKKYPFYHLIGDQPHKGNLVSFPYKIKFHIFVPIFDNDREPSMNQMAIVCVSEYDHPPPPLKISEIIKDKLLIKFHSLSIVNLTAFKLLALSSLLILLNGEVTLTTNHLAFNNTEALNHLIRKEKYKYHPYNTSIIGVQHLMHLRPTNPYIPIANQMSNSKYMVLCQLQAQSEMYFNAFEIHADKTFKQSKHYH